MDTRRTHSAPSLQACNLRTGHSPSAKTAFWATSASVSWESRDSASMAPSVGLLTFSSASARGIALLQGEAKRVEPGKIHAIILWIGAQYIEQPQQGIISPAQGYPHQDWTVPD